MNKLIELVAKLGSCKRQSVAPNEQIDRISSLPDLILVHILSLLPIENAMKTVLIRKFGKLWTSIYNLDFNVGLYHDYDDFENVDWLMYEERLSATIKMILKRLAKELKLANEIVTWIRFALRKKVRVLDLDFETCNG
ncbi:F-box/FBD/LRR-repeat protein At2g04230-like [Camellia sinensis]|uniref:F-box/FBD/LRR-repeat protein At2g04230-like n=1 Tax=Camellia sinensis TaxID=4442 RepID=UPI001035CF7F|nr:F-box/FBD/LRR-repeat protein At2g04230-like [Camellia sinensis]